MRYLAMTAGAIFIASSLAAAPREAPNKEKLDSIGPRMQKFVDSGEISGAVCLVGRKEGVIHESAVGLRDIAARAPMQKDTLFKIASMTKPITAIGIMILADEGKLDPNDDVTKYLPEFRGQMFIAAPFEDELRLKTPARPVKLRDLLTHTSGVATYPPGVNDVYVKRNRTLAETALATGLQPLQFEPGSRWAYSNSGIDTLGRIIEVVSGQSYERFLQERVFDPLGMKDTTFFPSKDQLARLAVTYAKDKEGKLTPSPNTLIGLPPNAKHPIPAGGLISCTGDLAKLYRMMLSRGELNGKRILSEKAVATMTQLQTGTIKTGFVEGMGFGYGWAYVREPKGVTAMLSPGTFGHGGAFGTQAWIDPKQDVFVILMIQRSDLPNSDASPMRRALQEVAVAAV
ncbi:MAG TPA: serine hydrolase domain-containing protein, partial [Gemmata sp.]|nr:serine hydrolase domain-containing protein [Gemmata sp.]